MTQVWTGQAAGSEDDPIPVVPDDAQVRLAFVFASPAFDIRPVLQQIEAQHPAAKVVFSTTAGEFTEARDTKGGASVALIAGDMVVEQTVQRGLSGDLYDVVERTGTALDNHHPSHPHRTCVVLLDPLPGTGEELVLSLAARFGPEVRLVGGAAGDDLAMASTQVGDGPRIVDDALVATMIHTRTPLAVGVAHGHRPLSTPLNVTRAEDNIVYEIDGRPAFDVWAENTQEHSGVDPRTLDVSGRAAYLLRYEAGLQLGPDTYKIRAPLDATAEGGLSFATGIPEGATLRITESDPESQRAAAKTAAEDAMQKLGAARAAGAVVFDCICRNLILQDRFQDAVRDVSHALGDAPLAGFETYGEIALDHGDMSGFHNTTTVILAFPEQ